MDVLLRCLKRKEEDKLHEELHDGSTRGHFDGDTMLQKILRESYYWIVFFKYAHAYAHKCKIHQKSTYREKQPTLPLQLVTIDSPFQKWEMDIVGEIKPHYSQQYKHILTTIDYSTC